MNFRSPALGLLHQVAQEQNLFRRRLAAGFQQEQARS
jgi:hypothetical protein